LENYEAIFDVEAGEIDEGFLTVVTSKEMRGYQDSQIATQTANITNKAVIASDSGDGLYEELFGPIPEPEFPEYEEAEAPAPSVVTSGAISGNFETGGSFVSSGISTMSANSFTSITYSSKTNTTVTFTIWYVNSSNQNNLLRMYNSGTQTWSYLLGQGQPAATNRSYTATGLNPGGVYTFRTGAWDTASQSWYYDEITVQTTGAQTPSITVTAANPTSMTVNVVYPSENTWGNRFTYYHWLPGEWTDVTGSGYYTNSGTYTISNLTPGERYRLHFAYYNHLTGSWADASYVNVFLPLPAANTQTYTYSNMLFHFDSWFANLFGSGRLTQFLTKVNNAYNVEYALVGGDKPYNGNKMQLDTSRDLPWYIEGQSGDPILWSVYNTSYPAAQAHVLKMIHDNTSMTETPIHELGHNFDSYKWTFEGEALTIFKIYYYMVKTGDTMSVSNANQTFTGSAYKNYMKSYADRIQGHINYDAAMSQGVYSPYSLAYTLAKIYEAVGEQAFKDTFAYFHSLGSGSVPTTNIGKFNLFLSKLKDFSGVDVFGSTYFTAQEKSIYQAELGGTIQYVYSPLTDAEIYAIAEYYVQEHFDASYSVYNLKVPLYDENGIRIAYTVPFKNGSGIWVGHVIVGASAANLSFYLIDPDTSSYDSILTYNNSGYKVMFEAPLYYFVNTQNPGLTGMSAMNSTLEGLSANDSATLSTANEIARNAGYLTASEMAAVENDVLFSEENRLQKLALLKDLSQEYEGIGVYQGDSSVTTFSAQSTETYALVPERAAGDQSYVRVKVSVNSADTYYGGNQGWWRSYGSPRNYLLDGNDMANTACGAVAFSDLIAYSVFKNISAYGDLLQYTDAAKWVVRDEVNSLPNPNFNASNFDKTFVYNGTGRNNYWFSKAEYTKFMDFYADLGEIPSIWGAGATAGTMENAFDELSDITGHDYTKSEPSGSFMSDLDSFLKTQLAADNPVFMLNYFVNDPNVNELIENETTNNHWMTITKYFINNSSNPAYAGSFVAIATWGKRYPVNTDLLRLTISPDVYYSDFFAYEILP
jgi:hypothetical protein